MPPPTFLSRLARRRGATKCIVIVKNVKQDGEVIFTGTLPPRLLMTNYTTLYLSQREKVKLLLLIGRSLAIEASVLRLSFFCILSPPAFWGECKKKKRDESGGDKIFLLSKDFRMATVATQTRRRYNTLYDNALVSRDALH